MIIESPLQKLVEVDIECAIPGCCNNVVRSKGKGRPSRTCLKHRYAPLSGRVSKGNRGRDEHLYHRKGSCSNCGITVGEMAKEIYPDIFKYDKRKAIQQAITHFNGDHIIPKAKWDDADKDEMNSEENIDTLCLHCHRKKTNVNGDWAK